MNIALLGYGKMGRLIEQIARDRDHVISAIKDIDRPEINYDNTDVAIDFSTPEVAAENIKEALQNGIPVISGTTGWLEHYDEVTKLCTKVGGAFLYASNFSLGVNVFFALNSYLAKLMGPLQQYKVSLEETHHIHKLDAPSGTAITLAESIIEHTPYESWNLEEEDEGKLPIRSKRIGEVPGTHLVDYTSQVDAIEIKHTAHSREGFALGAVIAAEWIQGRKGVFTMSDVLNLG